MVKLVGVRQQGSQFGNIVSGQNLIVRAEPLLALTDERAEKCSRGKMRGICDPHEGFHNGTKGHCNLALSCRIGCC